MKKVYCDICDEEIPAGHRYKSRIGDMDLCEKMQGRGNGHRVYPGVQERYHDGPDPEGYVMGRGSTKCPHNAALVCDHIKDCNECGWFPGVREKRLDRIRKDRQLQRINLFAHVANEEKIEMRRNKLR